jgi:hypothetical protein
MRSVTHTTQVPISGPHGTTARWNDGCSCTVCRRAHRENARVRKRARAQERLPADLRQQLLDAIHAYLPVFIVRLPSPLNTATMSSKTST